MRDEAVRPEVTMPAAAVAVATCDHIEQLFLAPSVADIWALHTAYMARFGFDRLVYGVTRFLFSHDFGGPNDHLMLTSHDPEYIRALQQGDLFGSVPMVRWTLTNTGVRSWGDVAAEAAAGRLDAAALRVLAVNRAYDVTAGISISFRNLHARARRDRAVCGQGHDPSRGRCHLGAQRARITVGKPVHAPAHCIATLRHPRRTHDDAAATGARSGGRGQNGLGNRGAAWPDQNHRGKTPAAGACRAGGRNHGAGGLAGKPEQPDLHQPAAIRMHA